MIEDGKSFEVFKNIRDGNFVEIRIYDPGYINKIKELDELFYIVNSYDDYVSFSFNLFEDVGEVHKDRIIISPKFSCNRIYSFVYLLELMKLKSVNKVVFVFKNVINLLNDSYVIEFEEDIRTTYTELDGPYCFDIGTPSICFNICNSSYNVIYGDSDIKDNRTINNEYTKFIKQKIICKNVMTSDFDFNTNIPILERIKTELILCHKLVFNKEEAIEFIKLI